MTTQNLKPLQNLLGYTFKNEKLLQIALTHRSCLNEPGVTESYERLEFLGDAVLEMIISVYLFNKYPDKMEGYLTAARSATVRTESLSKISKDHGIDTYIIMSKGEESTGGRNNPSILEDVIESLIGALYCDGGLDAANQFFKNFILPNAESIINENQLKDAKSLLQEKAQSKGFVSPLYKTVKESGPDHNKTFEVVVLVNDKEITTGSGKSKQEAEQNAAKKAVELI
ncbi:TPA: ribonuclease III [Candidatus Collierbacteria bacterium]|uniref:Ribonuclease 3 n=1 Tax=Candidatus Collierbacteria bacterium GW2011_GWA2_42_17 TaxID=1618378 RepID=A0A0G1C0F5_9BACT|nr:MAG: Ribonuclease 3 [Candidatus Collierbacteria bacterium GW2011_GWB2_42_12]KKS43103.1 MAG: Ribonuclease 3 [Candidatus Collierbacteria bacterium GW2011_GWA2_42_17]KKS63092.1 MAG: Ribonuclease 3 [Candidatus Collierbacteria bacterium GW2011_GWE2_42_48]KKS63390.1 MAG: Ribonuclease 3 [Candidatus Collierbacteria bacterium GW2011_GWD2_42_50]KKS65119.1 MAG: Ribonuclease 3 [Candidatus Collierbacteria bacterium GW2011_GWF2_42_51]HAI22367.1 ribonuclease III [Candidatus Collierbacteria bacterium]